MTDDPSGSQQVVSERKVRATSEMSKVSSSKFEVEKFDGKGNFGLWQRRVKALLVQQGLHKAVLGKSKKPTSMSDEDWEDIDLRAVNTIILCLADEVMYNVMDEETTVGIWDKLEKLYMTKSLSNVLYLKQKLYGLRMKEGTAITEHLNTFNKIIADLLSINVKVDEDDKALIFLTSLPSSYNHLVTTILYGKQTLKMEDVTSTLLSEEIRLQASTEESSAGLVVNDTSGGRGRSRERDAGKGRSRSKSKSKKVKCYFCKKEGHMKKNCEKRKAWLRNQNSSADTASVASDSGQDVLTVTTDSDSHGDWILDSGCSYHMSPNRSLFDTYKSCEGSSVMMGNRTSCKMVGIGTVKIKMFDGVVRTLTDVRHIPDLRLNLISLGTLDSTGCSISISGGVVKVKKGAMVVMKEEKKGNLYRLIGESVIGGVAVTSSEDHDADDTELWHMRLAHMSEKGMLELHKRGVLKGIKSCKLNFCKFCLFGKQKRLSFRTSSHKS